MRLYCISALENCRSRGVFQASGIAELGHGPRQRLGRYSIVVKIARVCAVGVSWLPLHLFNSALKLQDETNITCSVISDKQI